MDIGFKKEFTKCPNCGSEERFCEEIAKLAISKGLAQADWKLYFDRRAGGVFNQKNIPIVPADGRVPAFSILTDTCMGCGAIYTTEISIGTGFLDKPGAQMGGNLPFSSS